MKVTSHYHILYPHVYMSSKIGMKVGVGVIASHVLHCVMTTSKMTLGANRGMRDVQNWAFRREDTVIPIRHTMCEGKKLWADESLECHLAAKLCSLLCSSTSQVNTVPTDKRTESVTRQLWIVLWLLSTPCIFNRISFKTIILRVILISLSNENVGHASIWGCTSMQHYEKSHGPKFISRWYPHHVSSYSDE